MKHYQKDNTIPEGAEYFCSFTGAYYKGKWPNMMIFSTLDDPAHSNYKWVKSVGTHEKYLTKLSDNIV